MTRIAMKALLLVWAALWSCGAFAHEMSMAEMNMREVSKGQFIWSWRPSETNRPVSADLKTTWPEGCVESAEEMSLKCPSTGMVGTLSINGVGKAYSAAMVRVVWLDGQARVYTLTSA
ncbi:MAG: hypothetical protein JWP52_524, partial [Rhizobacter sp.]|nr:hypothetical protein [Rhizobacter sp.]